MMKRIVLLIAVVALTMLNSLTAQVFSVKASIDSTRIWIGQQTKITFEFNQQEGKFVQTPVFSDTIIGGLELVERAKSDTVKSDNGTITVKQFYTVTSFEDTLLLIPAFPFINGKDTAWSNQLSLKIIQPFVIDTTKNEITDIKDVFKPDFNLWYFLKKALPWFLGALLLAVVIFLLVKFLKRKKTDADENPELKLPAWEVALSKLNKIKQEKLWQQNRHKEYHTELTDVLREYIERSYQMQAMEMTSDEILNALSFLRNENKVAYQLLQQILQLADLIKFAKYNVGPEEHEMSLNNAVSFVNQTKVEEESKEDVVS
jgi:hypothetical protein